MSRLFSQTIGSKEYASGISCGRILDFWCRRQVDITSRMHVIRQVRPVFDKCVISWTVIGDYQSMPFERRIRLKTQGHGRTKVTVDE